MCYWRTTQHWTQCGCTVSNLDPQPGTSCRCTSNITDQGSTTWEGYCGRPQCPNPPRATYDPRYPRRKGEKL
ncbi:uncharacterized protein FFB20_04343 [Fusarium fujikuroi]|nr:uncharacterized protein FFE2_00807 [Fusarium fujikuroi]SCN70157.1 uncharacterized protein FFC1_00803 [Fusarium fujikuroi]SCN73245.1 uncharacterized protein FFB20_04343 [Fusarium fujikuroi]SCN73812.1 uncharacterized protein FFM5_00764 [Fusarium fujikuroi]SCO29233.1 uncharacterized protein FFNC_00804 [Fusarium fujikuroi]